MKNNLLLYLLVFLSLSINAQSYKFKTIVDLETTDVISQGRTGTCWSFSTSSFLESEIIRLTGKKINLSEMYTVRQTYPNKAWNYVMRQGKTQFSEGGLAHDVINSVRAHGLVPQYAFTGLNTDETTYNHAEMVAVLKAALNVYVSNPAKKLSPRWKPAIEGILDVYLGEDVTSFNYEGIQYTPESFLKMTKINTDNYITLTSFTHQPQYANFVLNIPDNFSNGSFYNLELNQLTETVNTALKNGFTIALDCDVSEKTFSAKHGIAIIPEDTTVTEDQLDTVQKEKNITADYRQQEFENFNTTDDHLMHITGLLKDANGTSFYKVKNSWGSTSERVANGGYVYISEAYFKLKTISVLLHKDALSNNLKKALELK